MDDNGTGGTAVVTAGTGGIGREVAAQLRRRGYAVTVVGRDVGRGEAVARELGARFLAADLSSLVQVRTLGERLAADGPLDLLVNAVGGMWSRRWETVDGIEASFAVNHLSPALLTELVLEPLRAGAPGRVVAVSSGAVGVALGHGVADLAGGVEAPGPYYGMVATGRAKLAHLAHLRGLSRRLDGSGVVVRAADPGPAATPNAAEMTPDILPPELRLHWDQIHAGVQRPAAQAVAPIVRAAVEEGGPVAPNPWRDSDPQLAAAVEAVLTPAVTAAVAVLTETCWRAALAAPTRG